MPSDPAVLRERRRRRLEKGICPSCGKRPVQEGFRACWFCAERMRVCGRNRRMRLGPLGLCTKCGRPVEDGDWMTCEACRRKARERVKATKEKMEG